MNRSKRPFNSVFEFCHRVLLILKKSPVPFSARQIAMVDLIATYGENFGLANKNLHGENPLYKHEYSLRHMQVKSALQHLTLLKLVRMELTEDHGAVYQKGDVDPLDYEGLEYASAYQEVAYQALQLVRDKTEEELIRWECDLSSEVKS